MSYTRQASMCNVCGTGKTVIWTTARDVCHIVCVCVCVCSSTLEGQLGGGVRSPDACNNGGRILTGLLCTDKFFLNTREWNK